MPSINGPSMTSIGMFTACRANSVSSSINSVMPFTKACAIRSLTGNALHSSAFLSSTLTAPSPRYFSARSNSASVPLACLFNTTSSTASFSSLGISSYIAN